VPDKSGFVCAHAADTPTDSAISNSVMRFIIIATSSKADLKVGLYDD
jgi:hypothetical protein